jgi:hypothetical protein
VNSYVHQDVDAAILEKLHEFGLLPEINRKSATHRIHKLALEIPDAGFLRGKIRNLLTDEECSAIAEEIRTDLLPDISDTVSNWKDNYDDTDPFCDDPEDYFSELVSALTIFQDEFIEYPNSVAQIESAFAEIDKAIEDLRSEQSKENNFDDYRVSSSNEASGNSRSIFDDVDI